MDFEKRQKKGILLGTQDCSWFSLCNDCKQYNTLCVCLLSMKLEAINLQASQKQLAWPAKYITASKFID